ncbi:hypothetical protein R6Q57_001933, partial [Mikania cordata]
MHPKFTHTPQHSSRSTPSHVASAASRSSIQVDVEMETHAELLKQIEDSPMDINAIVTRRLKDFAWTFFLLLGLEQDAYL